MSMTKQQMVGYGCTGVFAVAAAALGYLLFDASSVRAEAEQELADETARFERYNSADVFPSLKSIASVKSNETGYVAWREAARAMAAQGDCAPAPAEEPSVFKQRLQAEVRRMLALPGGVNGRIAAPEFLFGFEQYLGESGVLPQAGDVPRLATQLATVARVVDAFAEAGVLEVKAIRRIEKKAEEEPASQTRSRKKAKGKKSAADAEADKTVRFDYAFEFAARPAAVTDVLNRLTGDTRFMVVSELAFRESADTILDRLTARDTDADKAAKAGTSSRRRSRRGSRAAAPSFAEAEGAKADAAKGDRLVVDPELDAPILVSFMLAVYDFGTGGPSSESAAAEKPQGEKEAK